MTSNGTILLVDSDSTTLSDLDRNIRSLGFGCTAVRSSSEALQIVRLQRPSIVIADLFLDGQDGISTLKEIKKIDPNVVVMLLTSNTHVSSATEAIRFGAFDYLQKPVSSKRLQITILRALNHKYNHVQKNLLIYEKLEDSIRKFMSEKQPPERNDLNSNGTDGASQPISNVIGQSSAMREIFSKVARISRSNANVMIYGESGTGKELIARSIHTCSARREHALIPVDCVALPENLLESELFGYEKGAFTGAESLRRGLFEYAHEGTLFLDEITELAPNLQAKLLRVLQESEFRRVGGKRLIKVDMRVVSATNIKPALAIEAGKLREDLYYRLNVFPIYMPPLRERRTDILLLAEFFLEKFARENNKTIRR
ncbi:sigma-54 dependent transcriptional regulator, partial [bacterium]|nr:sigma-54 dependent transcriptional regulator [bacterium]